MCLFKVRGRSDQILRNLNRLKSWEKKKKSHPRTVFLKFAVCRASGFFLFDFSSIEYKWFVRVQKVNMESDFIILPCHTGIY